MEYPQWSVASVDALGLRGIYECKGFWVQADETCFDAYACLLIKSVKRLIKI